MLGKVIFGLNIADRALDIFDAGELKDLKKNTIMDFIKNPGSHLNENLEYKSVIMNSIHHLNVFRVVAFF